jgi:hypothetical protein
MENNAAAHESDAPPPRRNRGWYVFLTLATIAAGLVSRRFPGLLPAFLGKYPGDALWSLMVFFALGALWPAASRLRLALAALGISFAVEFLKLYPSEWLGKLRQTRLGHLVLGHVFSWQNLVAYAVGVLIGISIEVVAFRKKSKPYVAR